MKRLFQLTFVTIISIAFHSCSKNKISSNNIISGSSQWTFKGITYGGLITTNDTNNIGLVIDVFKSTNGVSDSISITFWSHPTASATFTLNNGTLPKPDSNACTMLLNHSGDLYISTGKIGDKVNLRISGDTLTASFTNITILINDTSFVTETVSGILIKQ
jgi:hypothetical protein